MLRSQGNERGAAMAKPTTIYTMWHVGGGEVQVPRPETRLSAATFTYGVPRPRGSKMQVPRLETQLSAAPSTHGVLPSRGMGLPRLRWLRLYRLHPLLLLTGDQLPFPSLDTTVNG